MKKQPELNIHLSEDLLRRLLYLCEAENRSPNNQLLLLIRNSIAYFERAKGRMNPAKLAGYDITPYLPDEDENA
jgi:hypothetical protein